MQLVAVAVAVASNAPSFGISRARGTGEQDIPWLKDMPGNLVFRMAGFELSPESVHRPVHNFLLGQSGIASALLLKKSPPYLVDAASVIAHRRRSVVNQYEAKQ